MAASSPAGVYPDLTVEHIQNPNRLWAIPVLGAVVKGIILIPVFVWLYLLSIAWGVLIVINSFVVLFSGHYWDPAYRLTLGFTRIYLRVMLYFTGLTDRYPGFGLANDDPAIALEIAKPESPNRLWAVPILGGLVKVVILIPYLVYLVVLQYAAGIGIVISSFWVLFMGRYPEAVYELTRDYIRVLLAEVVYITGLSDSYPSFRISMNHAGIKIALIVAVILLWFVPAISGAGN